MSELAKRLEREGKFPVVLAVIDHPAEGQTYHAIRMGKSATIALQFADGTVEVNTGMLTKEQALDMAWTIIKSLTPLEDEAEERAAGNA